MLQAARAVFSGASGCTPTTGSIVEEEDGPAGPVKDITEEVLDYFMSADGWKAKKHVHMTFKDEAFALITLDGLLKTNIDLSCLLSLDISNNKLQELNCLSGTSPAVTPERQGGLRFQSLQVLKARHNCLMDFVAALPTLKELDLGYNYLPEIPTLAGLPKLQVLVLAHNQIRCGFRGLSPLTSLHRLDLSSNDIDLMPINLEEELQHLEKLPLHSLRLQDNPFIFDFPEYEGLVLCMLPTLKKLDRIQDMAEARRAWSPSMFVDVSRFHAVAMDRKQRRLLTRKSDEDEAPIQMPNFFKDFFEPIEESLMDPRNVAMVLQQLEQCVNTLCKLSPMEARQFWRNKKASDAEVNAEELQAKIQAWSGNVQILFGRTTDVNKQESLVRALGSLAASSRSGALSTHCANILDGQLMSNRDIEDLILDVINDTMVQPLLGFKEVDAEVEVILRSLMCFESPRLPDILVPMASWLTRMYCSTLPPHEGITKLLARSLARKMSLEAALASSGQDAGSGVEVNLPRHVVSTLEHYHVSSEAVWQQKAIPHLEIVKATTLQWTGSGTAKAYDNAVNFYEMRNLHSTLMKSCINSYETEGSMHGPATAALNIDIRRLSFRCIDVVAAVLDALTGLVAQSVVALNAIGDQLLEYLMLAITADTVPDPALLAASLRGLCVFLQHYKIDKPTARRQFLARMVKELQNMKPYLELVDRDTRRFNELWRAAQLRAQGGPRAESRPAPSFGHLRDLSIIQCLTASVSLIEFFTAEAGKDDLCQDVSEAMNGSDREMLLFKLLEVPSSALTSAVLRCIAVVDFTQMSSDEVHHLILMIQIAMRSLPETTMLVEKLIDQILKFARDPFGHGASSSLRLEHAKEAVITVSSTLHLNVKISAKGPKLAAKVALTEKCVAFLRVASMVAELRNPVMLRPEYTSLMERILKAEDMCRPGEIDVPVERTWGGRFVETLLPFFAQHNRLRVRGKVAFRVIARVADILEGQSCDADGKDLADSHTSEESSRGLSIILSKAECDMWDEGHMKHRLRSLDDIEREQRTEQQVMFAQANGVTRICKFLTGTLGDGGALLKLREVLCVEEAENFLMQTRPDAKRQEQQGEKKASEAPKNDGKNHLNTSTLKPLIDLGGLDFYGASDEGLDLVAPPYICPCEFGGEVSVLFVARWDALQNWSTILDFGSGAPQDNILIANMGRTGNLVFQVYVGSKKLSKKVVVTDCISIGETNTYLCTVSKSGHMRVLCDGRVVAERFDGWLPPTCKRDHLYIGRSNFGIAQPFRGKIGVFKVWVGICLNWEDIIADLPEDEDNDKDASSAGTTGIIQTLLKPRKDEDCHARESLLLGQQASTAIRYKLAVSENFFDDAMLEKVNTAFPIAAALRSIFVLLRMPANGGVRADIAEVMKDARFVAELVTLTRACGPLNCSVAAKFLRVMSLALELPPTQNEEDVQRVVVYDVLRAYYVELAPIATMADSSPDPLVSRRGRRLAAEITRLAGVICRTVPFCTVSDDRYFQTMFTEQCLERLVPHPVVAVVSLMILTEPGEGSGVDHAEISGIARAMLTGIMENCPRIKYNILEVFGTAVAAGKAKAHTLTSLLDQSKQLTEGAEFEHFLNTGGTRIRSERTCLIAPGLAQRDGVERVLGCARALVLLGGQRLPVQNRSHNTPCFSCILTTKAFYVLDLTASGHPDNPKVVQSRDLLDMTRLIKGNTGQDLHIGWACKDRWNPGLIEEFMTLVFLREEAQRDLLGKLQRLSIPPQGGMQHTVPVQRDLTMESALEAFKVSPEFLIYVESESDELRLVMVTDSELFELEVCFSNWTPPLDSECLVELEDASGDPEVAASGRGVAAEAQQPAGGEGAETGPSADEISKARAAMRLKSGMFSEHILDKVLDCPGGPVPMAALSKMSFYPEARPRMELIFSNSGYSDMTAILLDESAKEELRRLLTSKAADWEQSYENAGPGGSPEAV